jgi:copper chaperone
LRTASPFKEFVLVTEATLARTQLLVPDMSCDHCVRTITNTLSPLSGIASVSVDLPTKRVEVAYDPNQVSTATMADALAAEDYPVAESNDIA